MKRLCIVAILLITALSTVMAAGQAEETNGEIMLRINTSVDAAGIAAGHPPAASVDAFVKYLKEHGGDEIFDIRVFYSNQLSSKLDQTLPALKTGAFEIGNDGYGNCGGMTTAMRPLNLPFLLSTIDQAENFWDSPVGEKMRAGFEKDMDMKVLWSVYIGFRHISNSKNPIHTPADMKGLKIRTMNDPFQLATFNALGAAPTPLAYSELFTAMQQKLVDGQENPISNVYTAKMYEVQKYLTKTAHTFTWGVYFASQQWWDSLPEEAKTLLTEAGRAAEKASLASLKKVEASMEEEIVTKGMEIYTPTKQELKQFQDACSSIYKGIEDEMGTEFYNEVLQTAKNALD